MENDTQVELEFAGFWLRAWAFLIDMFLIGLITTPFTTVMVDSTYYTPSDRLMEFLVFALFPALYVILFWVYKGATPGKMAISAKIVDATSGEHPAAPRFIARYVGYLLSMLPLGLGFVWIAFDKRKQGWHDKLSGTMVVRQKRRPSFLPADEVSL